MLNIIFNNDFNHVLVKHVSPSAGPVFIPPGAAAVAAPSSKIAPTASQGNYLTQTVYGFLDFTTTIGNTVMVFSPQSAAAVPNGEITIFLIFTYLNLFYIYTIKSINNTRVPK